MGFLVMDEAFDQWTVAKNPYDYHLVFQRMVEDATHVTWCFATEIIRA